MRTFFVSDTHFGHANIIKYCNRPFVSLERMDSILIKNWNSRIEPEDTVYFLGDFCFKRSSEAEESCKNAFEYYKEQLNGNIIFCVGNHDHSNGVKSKIQSIVIEIANQRIHMTHKPEHSNYDFSINLCGHVHDKWKICKLTSDKGQETICVNVGVDVWNFFPVTWDEINSRIQKYLK